MAMFDDPFSDRSRLGSGCTCGQHTSQGQHDALASGLARGLDRAARERAPESLAAMRPPNVQALNFRRVRRQHAHRHATGSLDGEEQAVLAGECRELALEAGEAQRLVDRVRVLGQGRAHGGDVRGSGSLDHPGHI